MSVFEGVHINGPSDDMPPAELERAERDPDAVVFCCDRGAMYGIDYCTCWEPVFDLEQSEDLEHGAPECRTKRCIDCAFSKGSPERSDAYGEERLFDTAGGERSFWCHQGVRRVIAYRHPDGRELPAGEGDYRPPESGGRIWRADGRVGELCAGWAARREPEAPTVIHRTYQHTLPDGVGNE